MTPFTPMPHHSATAQKAATAMAKPGLTIARETTRGFRLLASWAAKVRMGFIHEVMPS